MIFCRKMTLTVSVPDHPVLCKGTLGNIERSVCQWTTRKDKFRQLVKSRGSAATA